MDIINQIVAQEQSIFITLAEFAVFTVLLSLIIYHLIIYFGRKTFQEGRNYLYFSGLFLGLLIYIFIDTCQFGILFRDVMNVPAWTPFLLSVSWMIILKSILHILQLSLKTNDKKTALLNKVYWSFVACSAIWVLPVIFPLEQFHYPFFLALWMTLGIAIGFLSGIYIPVLRSSKNINLSNKIIGWTSLSYIIYIWFYKLIISSTLLHAYLPFWMVNNFLKILVAFIFSYALARRFNSEFTDLVELKENLEKRVEVNTSELRLAKDKIEEVNIQKTNYFINVAHETKTPLTLIGNYLDRYSKRVGASDELTIIKENFDLLGDAMVLFLDVEKFEKGEIMYQNDGALNISAALALKMPLFWEAAANQKRQFRYEIANDVTICADPLAIERIIHNLFDNALKFTDKEDEIVISLTQKNDMAVLTVSDTGSGIDSSSIPYIFDIYYQASVENNNRKGFGMGLYVVQKTVNSLGGTLEVKSTSGKGTCFTIRLPLIKPSELSDNHKNKQENAPKVRENSVEHPETFTPGCKNILVVEDHVDMLKYIRDELTGQYNVFVAGNGIEAINVLKTIPKPDLILSDVMMDGMDGYDLYHHISKDERYISIPFIFITARSNHAEKIDMLNQGVFDYIYKPFSMEELKAKIVSILKNTSKHRKSGLQDAINAIHNQLHSTLDSSPTFDKWEQFATRSHQFELTERQIEIIKLVDQGLEYKEIANRLHLSPKTIHRHIQILFEKFHVHNKLELMKVLFE